MMVLMVGDGGSVNVGMAGDFDGFNGGWRWWSSQDAVVGRGNMDLVGDVDGLMVGGGGDHLNK